MTKYDASKKDDVTIYQVNLADEKMLAKRFNVVSFPHVFYISKGQVIAEELGYKTEQEIEDNVKKYFKQ